MRGDTVWIASPEGAMHFQKVEVSRISEQGVWVTQGLDAGDLVVTLPHESSYGRHENPAA